jgi:serine/threonine protein kinase
MKGLGMIHGAIKPENIFFKKKNVPEFKLLDFSCAFFLDE